MEPRTQQSDGDAASEQRAAPPPARALYSLGPPLLALLLAGVLIQLVFGGRRTNFEELALGAETRAVFAKDGDFAIHCMDLRDLDPCLAGLAERRAERVGLWLGNSMLHAVNHFQPGQETAPAILHRRLLSSGLDLVTLSEANANLQEHYVLFEYLRQRVKIDRLILPLVFDDTREDGVRASIAPALSDPALRAALAQTSAGAELVRRRALTPTPTDDLAGLADTVQERAEGALNRWLEESWSLWQSRRQMRGDVVRTLYTLRNDALGITTRTTRKQIPARYRRNLDSLEATLEAARRGGVDVTLYVAPLRPDLAMPYDPTEYAEFKRTAEALAREYGARFLNLESAVPTISWGTWGGVNQDDFMHFAASGHEILAQALAAALLDGTAAR